MAESLFRMNPQLPALGRKIQHRANRAIDRIWIRLQKYGQQWARQAIKVTPVGVKDKGPKGAGLSGRLRQNWFIIPIRNGNVLSIVLANHMEYGKWLEFGTAHIAHGHVLSWKQGDPPIMHWPAKDKNLQYSIHDSPKKHARMSAIAEKAGTPGLGEQMPMARPTGYELVPQIIADVERIIREELGRAA